ncbi:MAG: indoleamine 2,3-dioxygenase, partial [Sulfuricella sp.]|nr:indoleamine 2,3-dioxygenase [Sulfuricella sp.]
HGGKLRINFESFFHGIRPFLTGSMAETGTPNQVFFSVLPKVAVKDYRAIKPKNGISPQRTQRFAR